MVKTALTMPGHIDGWDDLLRFSADILASDQTSQYPSREQVDAVMAMVDRVPDEPLERARYYSLGHIVCAFSDHISIPENATELISLGGALLQEAHQEERGKGDRDGLRLNELTGKNMELAFTSASQDAGEELPRELILAADCLHLANLRRTCCAADKSKLPTNEDVRALKLSVFHVGLAAPATATNLFRRALMDAYAFRKGTSSAAVVNMNPLIRQVKGEKGMRNIDMLRVAAYLAKLRLDELNVSSVVEPHISRTPLGKYDFDHTYLKTKPRPLRKPWPEEAGLKFKVIHESRIGCPALYVPRIIRSVLSIIPEIAIAADSEIREEEAV
jgi:hypothetical protein